MAIVTDVVRDVVRRVVRGIDEGLEPFTVEYQTIYDAFTIKPSASIAKQQNIMVKSLVDSGVWVKLDTFYVLAGHTNTNGESLINWFNPGTFNGSLVNTPAFVALEGFTGDGATSYINSNYNASINGINYIQNSASSGFYSRTDLAEEATDFGALSGNNRIYIYSRKLANQTWYVINDNTVGVVSNNNSKGLFTIVRNASNSRTIYKNTSALLSDAVVSAGVPNANMTFLAVPPLGAFSTKQLSLGFIGGGLIQTDITNLYNAFQTYMTSNGKQV